MEIRGIEKGRLAEFIAGYCGEPRELRLEVRALRGGLESAGVADVTARFSDVGGRPRSFRFVVKLLEGAPAREAAVYQHLVSGLATRIAPALLGIKQGEPQSCLLFLERVRPVRRWPWGDEAAARRLLAGLAHLHATPPPTPALEVLSGWDYESELAGRVRLAAELLEAMPREEDLRRLRRGRRPRRELAAGRGGQGGRRRSPNHPARGGLLARSQGS